MKRAFTLIELLVVIAIIAILAAILFPVFAQAKFAAKKSVTLSSVKQVSTGGFLYQGDWDDAYFVGRYCAPNSALNPKFRAASYNTSATSGCTSGMDVYNIVDDRAWQKFLMPYVKSVELFENPIRTKSASSWTDYGQLWGAISFNKGITGTKNVNLNTGAYLSGGNITSFTGGVQSGIPNPSAAALFIDALPLNTTPFIPSIMDSLSTNEVTGYPRADREFWAFRLTKMTQAECGQSPQPLRQPDLTRQPSGGLTIGRADGSAKFMSAGAVIAGSPPASEYISGGSISQDTCYITDPLFAGARYSGTVNKNINYPLWGLGQ